MMPQRLDFSSRGKPRVYLLTAVGTLFCVLAAFAVDSYSFETGTWRWGDEPLNNLVIPLLLAPPLLFLLLSKLRELSIAHAELLTVASTDALTACLNRRAFTTVVEGYLERVGQEQHGKGGALLVLDIDHFKLVNDSFGHDLGDRALRLVADTIRAAVRQIDLVGRLGGEEFGVFMPGVDPVRTALIADRIRAAVRAAAFAPYGRVHPLSVSVGGATFDRSTTFADLYRAADQRLYAAKNAGRDRVDITPLGRDVAA